MKKCDCCGRELGQYDDLYLVNDGLPSTTCSLPAKLTTQSRWTESSPEGTR